MIDLDYKEDANYTTINGSAKCWDDLPEQIQKDLIVWIDIPQSEIDDDSYNNLVVLYAEGGFRAWDCEECGDRVFEGMPRNWDDFQGSKNQDFSYFGNPDKYTKKYLESLCDSCRRDSN